MLDYKNYSLRLNIKHSNIVIPILIIYKPIIFSFNKI